MFPIKAAALAEAFRVLRPGGALVACDVVSGTGDALHFPVPWGSEEMTHLVDIETLGTLVGDAGFRLDSLKDETRVTVDWWQAMKSRPPGGAKPLSPLVIFGADAARKVANLMRNLAEDRVREVVLIAVKPG